MYSQQRLRFPPPPAVASNATNFWSQVICFLKRKQHVNNMKRTEKIRAIFIFFLLQKVHENKLSFSEVIP
jgi:hypothetical protein